MSRSVIYFTNWSKFRVVNERPALILYIGSPRLGIITRDQSHADWRLILDDKL